jgi:hypothetical protein
VDWRGCRGLDVDGEKLERTERSAIPGIFTGAELHSNPELAKLADIELLIGEFVSLCMESTKPSGSSRCKSSKALPRKEPNLLYLVNKYCKICKICLICQKSKDRNNYIT